MPIYPRELRVGERISVPDWSAVVHHVHGLDVATPSPTPSQVRYMHVWATEDIAAFSLFSVTGVDAKPWGEPMTGVAARIGIEKAGSALLMLTNGSIPIAKDTWGLAKPVGFFEVTRLQITGLTPAGVGLSCGPDLDGWGICGEGHGFVYLGSDDAGRAEVIRTREPVSVLGCVTEEISAFRSPHVLGSGKIAIAFRNSEDEVRLAKSPATGEQPWEVLAFNMTDRVFRQGWLVKAESVLGTGLVVCDAGVMCDALGSSSGWSESSESEESGSGSEEEECVSPERYGWDQFPGYDENAEEQALIHRRGCLRWLTIGDCDEESGSGI